MEDRPTRTDVVIWIGIALMYLGAFGLLAETLRPVPHAISQPIRGDVR